MKAMRPNDPEHLKAAYADLGLKEIRGSRHNPRVLDMFALSGHSWVKDDETAWCAAAVGAWLVESGKVGSKSLAARSYLKWGKKTTRPKRGDVVVFKRGNSSWQGHVALYLGEDVTRVFVIGGNQSNSVSIASYRKSKLLGYRKPSSGWNSKVVGAASAVKAGSVFGLADYAGYIPDVVSLVQPAEGAGTNWPLIILLIGGMGIAAFIIWDRVTKARELGI